MGLNTAFLERIAQGCLMWPVMVRVVPTGGSFSGEIDFRDGHWQIALCEGLGSEERGGLAFILYHECGHAALGHVSRVDTGRGPGMTPDEYRQKRPGEEGERVACFMQEQEDEANDYARRNVEAYERLNGYGTFEWCATRNEDADD